MYFTYIYIDPFFIFILLIKVNILPLYIQTNTLTFLLTQKVEPLQRNILKRDGNQTSTFHWPESIM